MFLSIRYFQKNLIGFKNRIFYVIASEIMSEKPLKEEIAMKKQYFKW